jgi:thymidylate synthase (methanogen type)
MKIVAQTCGDAHEAACDVIIESHREIDIQTHVDKKEFTLEFRNAPGKDDFLTIVVEHPLQEPQVSAGSPYGPGYTGAYKKQFLTLTPTGPDAPVYTYWNRLEDHPYPIRVVQSGDCGDCVEVALLGNGNGDGFPQVSKLIEKLAADPNSRRGVMVTWAPLIDALNPEPPCMNWVQFVIRDRVMHMRVIFRSQDMLLGLPENLVGCTALFEYVLNGVNRNIVDPRCTMGNLTLVSFIPHIYKRRDQNYFDKMRSHIYAKKMNRQWNVRVTE